MGQERPARSQVLAILRNLRDWTQQELADAAGLTRGTIGAYEQGILVPSPGKLWELAQLMGYKRGEVRNALRLVRPLTRPRERWVGPVRFSPEQERAIREFGTNSSRLAGLILRDLLARAHVQVKAAQDRQDARTLWVHLRAERRLRTAVREKREYQTWAVAELLCEESIQAAPSKPDRALELAEAAVVAAELARGETRWRLRVLGYAHAHVGNAWRVLEKLVSAKESFKQCQANWQAGKGGDPLRLLNEGRVFGLEASLCREELLLREALALLAQGLEVSNRDEAGYLLINKAKVLETAEDYEGAIEVLREAAPVLKGRDLRLTFVLRFDLAVNLCHLRRFSEVDPFLPELRGLALQLGKELERLRVKWLEGWTAAGVGRLQQGVEILSVVREEFMTRQLTYDAALVSMDLAEALLQLKRIAQVKSLAKQMTPIFEGRGVHQKALEALLLFRKAAEGEILTLELVRSIRNYLQRAQTRPSLHFVDSAG
jgi:transcriptional regulator with XRE-family HTH domain